MTDRSIPWMRRTSVRFGLTLSACLALVLGGGLYWLDVRTDHLVAQDQQERAETTAAVAISSLKSIMLAGRGPIAHQWLERLSRQPSVESARIYRLDGVEAFHDLDTVRRVNAFLGEPRFHRDPIPGGGRIPPRLQALFREVVQGGEATRLREDRRLTMLYPISKDDSCQECHGYDIHPLRGVLVMRLDTAAATARMQQMEQTAQQGLVGIVALLLMVAALLLRWWVLHPLSSLHAAATIVGEGDLNHRIGSQRRDEFGEVARAFDRLVDRLANDIRREAEQKERQRLLTEAVIELSGQTAEEDLLRHVGELGRRIVRARYAMVTWVDGIGKRHLIPIGLSEEEAARIARTPEGKGLLGLFWHGHESIRVADIASHPESVGFPEGHPHMRTLLGVPIVFANEPLGAIYLCDREDDQPFTEDDERMMETLAAACAVALSNLRNSRSELARINQRLKSREIELELLNEELMQANEAKSQFLANTSHELRTPLNAIIGFSELLMNPKVGSLTGKQQRYVEHVHTSGKRLLTIINDLLDISKIEAGMMTIEETPCRPAGIARDVVQELLPLAEQKHQQLVLDTASCEGERVVLDAGKFHQMLVNL
ncbi:MAG: histidine kinase dimerization/phospho-acceptor domain-containing protein, partial [Mariprofundaceae bacterium]